MTEDEKYLYEEFDMDDTCKINLKIYKRLYDAVMLMSLDYSQQINNLPQYVNVPDEIALVFDDEVIAVMDNLRECGMLSSDNCKMVKMIQNRLLEMNKAKDKELWSLKSLEESEEWENCRKDAQLLLASLYRL